MADRIADLAVECLLPLTRERWQELGLMPDVPGGTLVWKHVTEGGAGNNGYPYQVGESFACVGQACAGPAGALRDWRNGDDHPHVIAIAGECYDLRPDEGVYLCLRGTPIAQFKTVNFGDGWEPPVEVERLLGASELVARCTI